MGHRGVSFAVFVSLLSSPALAALEVGTLGPNVKVRPADTPTPSPNATLFAARNEVEPFQLVLRASGGASSAVSVKLKKPLATAGGASIPAGNVVLYRVAYYDVGTPSNSEGASGRWPDPLIPDVDSYAGEQRNAFPFDVPDGETRVVWVDVLVPSDAVPGDYSGELEVLGAGAPLASVGLSLHVGSFALPSTASLASAFGMAWSAPCVAHTGQVACDASWNEEKANLLRARYLRAGLEHRFSISDSNFQPPLGGSAAAYEKHVLPYLDGTGNTRLGGAKLTATRLDGSGPALADWVSYAKSKGFFDRLFYYPVDEPAKDASKWSDFVTGAAALHAVDANARIIITAAIQEADAQGATSSVDIFCPVLNYLEDKPGNGSAYEGNQRSKYAAWLGAKDNRALYAYQSCMSHGCGSCGDPTSDSYFTGWPNRVIDSGAVQNRAFPWVAFNLDVSGELYFDSTGQLATAWDANGQCAFSGHGDGTLFYPGKPSLIGGSTDVPIESIRMKLIREGMEDYEYLALAAKKDAAKAKSIAQSLFPHAYECAKTPGQLEAARKQLFDLLDQPGSGGSAGSGGGSGAGGGAGTGAGGLGAGGTGGPSGAKPGASDDGGCSCRMGAPPPRAAGLGFLGLILALASARRRVQRTSRTTLAIFSRVGGLAMCRSKPASAARRRSSGRA